MPDDLITPEDIFDATEQKESGEPFDPSKFDELLNEIADIVNNKLLRKSGGITPSDTVDLGDNDIESIRDIIGSDSQDDKVWRLTYDGPEQKLRIEQNMNTDENPSWQTRFSFELDSDGDLLVGQTESIAWHEGNDGAQSGLDADTVRGFTPNDLLADSSGTIINYRVSRFEATKGQKEFQLNNFDPGDEEEIVSSGGLLQSKGSSYDYERIDQEATVANSSSNNGTYTVRATEIKHRSSTNQTIIPVVSDIPNDSDDSGDITINNNNYSINGVDKTVNGFLVTGDQTSDAESTKIVFNEERELNEVVIAHILKVAKPGAGGGINADKLDGFEASELGGIRPIDPVQIIDTTDQNFDRVEDLKGKIPDRANWASIRVHVWGVTGENNAVMRTYVTTPSQNPSNDHPGVAATFGYSEADDPAGLRQYHSDADTVTAKLNDDHEIRIKKIDPLDDVRTKAWIVGWS